MKICPKCNIEHNQNGRFCSRKCSNSRIFSEESKRKKSEALKGRKSSRIQSLEEVEKRVASLKATWKRKYETSSFEELGSHNRRKRVFEEQQYCCSKCGLSEWLGLPINLELEHIDGNNQNNERANLKGLCPNCHSLTDTWRGRNKQRVDKHITDELLIESFYTTSNIRQALLKAGLTPKGGNYKRLKMLIPREVPPDK